MAHKRTGKRLLAWKQRKWHEQGGACCRCGDQMPFPEAPLRGVHIPPNAPTVDHMISRNDPNRGKVEGKLWLAHSACNNQHGSNEVKALPKEELWRRSGRYPTSTGEHNALGSSN
jgi:5-methylcytosine-specific restriction endonuclease McrA